MSESIQFEFFEYLYHQVLRKEDDWAARELFREHYRANEPKVMAHRYDHASIGCLYLYTTPHVLLDDLMAQPIGEGDVFSNANTIILMGRTRQEGRDGPRPLRRQAPGQRLQRRDRALPDHRPRPRPRPRLLTGAGAVAIVMDRAMTHRSRPAIGRLARAF